MCLGENRVCFDTTKDSIKHKHPMNTGGNICLEQKMFWGGRTSQAVETKFISETLCWIKTLLFPVLLFKVLVQARHSISWCNSSMILVSLSWRREAHIQVFRPLTLLERGRWGRWWCLAVQCVRERSRAGPTWSLPVGPNQLRECGWGLGPVRRRPRGPVRNRVWPPAASSSDCPPRREAPLPPPVCEEAGSHKVACPVCCLVYCLWKVWEREQIITNQPFTLLVKATYSTLQVTILPMQPV